MADKNWEKKYLEIAQQSSEQPTMIWKITSCISNALMRNIKCVEINSKEIKWKVLRNVYNLIWFCHMKRWEKVWIFKVTHGTIKSNGHLADIISKQWWNLNWKK